MKLGMVKCRKKLGQKREKGTNEMKELLPHFLFRVRIL